PGGGAMHSPPATVLRDEPSLQEERTACARYREWYMPSLRQLKQAMLRQQGPGLPRYPVSAAPRGSSQDSGTCNGHAVLHFLGWMGHHRAADNLFWPPILLIGAASRIGLFQWPSSRRPHRG